VQTDRGFPCVGPKLGNQEGLAVHKLRKKSAGALRDRSGSEGVAEYLEKDHFGTNRWRGGGYAGVYGMRERRELGIGPYDWKATGSGEWAVGRVKS